MMGLPYPIPGPVHVDYAVEVFAGPPTLEPVLVPVPDRAAAEHVVTGLILDRRVTCTRIVQELSIGAPWEPWEPLIEETPLQEAIRAEIRRMKEAHPWP